MDSDYYRCVWGGGGGGGAQPGGLPLPGHPPKYKYSMLQVWIYGSCTQACVGIAETSSMTIRLLLPGTTHTGRPARIKLYLAPGCAVYKMPAPAVPRRKGKRTPQCCCAAHSKLFAGPTSTHNIKSTTATMDT